DTAESSHRPGAALPDSREECRKALEYQLNPGSKRDRARREFRHPACRCFQATIAKSPRHESSARLWNAASIQPRNKLPPSFPGPTPPRGMRNFVKEIRRNAADFLYHLRGIPGKMPLQFLKNTLRILQCEIPLRTAQIIAFIQPAVTLV